MRSIKQLVLLSVLPSIAVPAFCQRSQYLREKDRDALRGVQAISVVVDVPEQNPIGITPDRVQTDIELRLRRAGISLSDKAEPQLQVHILLLCPDTVRDCAVGLSLDFYDFVLLTRKKGEQESTLVHDVLLWRRGGILHVGRSLAQGSIRRDLADYADEFINDYLAANPKP
jgi:hypothetical protein